VPNVVTNPNFIQKGQPVNMRPQTSQTNVSTVAGSNLGQTLVVHSPTKPEQTPFIDSEDDAQSDVTIEIERQYHPHVTFDGINENQSFNSFDNRTKTCAVDKKGQPYERLFDSNVSFVDESFGENLFNDPPMIQGQEYQLWYESFEKTYEYEGN
jgi:hypothetical protein